MTPSPLSDLTLLLKISRPRFWLYLAGPYLTGYVSSMGSFQDLLLPTFWLYFLYFLVPANILLYGINDLSDEDTDKFNEKKKTHEHFLEKKERSLLQISVLICILITVIVISQQTIPLYIFILGCFLFLAVGYSVPPFRFKAKPFIDFSSNILYVLPGFFAYALHSQTLPSPLLILALFCWTSAMHLFSAVPDIQADQKAGLLTTAVFIGKRNSLLLCTFLWLLFAMIIGWFTHLFLIPFLLTYAALPILILLKKVELEKAYWCFPYLNAFFGFLSFWYMMVTRFYV